MDVEQDSDSDYDRYGNEKVTKTYKYMLLCEVALGNQ